MHSFDPTLKLTHSQWALTDWLTVSEVKWSEVKWSEVTANSNKCSVVWAPLRKSVILLLIRTPLPSHVRYVCRTITVQCSLVHFHCTVFIPLVYGFVNVQFMYVVLRPCTVHDSAQCTKSGRVCRKLTRALPAPTNQSFNTVTHSLAFNTH